MTEVISLLVAGYLLTLVTWLFYIAIMHLRMVRHRLHPVAKVNAYILLFFGLILDFLLNVIVGSVLFLDLPRESLLTERLKRYKREGGWRAVMSWWICEHLLNQFDDGHC